MKIEYFKNKNKSLFPIPYQHSWPSSAYSLFPTSGFTLIELVIVVSIIVILSGVSLFALSGARQSGRDADRKADLAQIASGLEMYKADLNNYPVDGGFLFGGTNTLSGGGNIYIQAVPNDPDTSKSYDYTVRPNACDNSSNRCLGFCLWASLEDSSATLPTYCTSTNCGSVPGGFNFCITNP